MSVLQNITTILKQPLILQSYKHIFLLSHMRANTSLFGHILGSHQDIEGYYEMHIGYYSWKSLIRQKLIYFNLHKQNKKKLFMFDKILHSEHEITLEVLQRENVVTILSLREPEQTVPSIVKLYEKADPSHKFCSIAGAAKYYLERLDYLEKLAKAIPKQYIYIDAQEIRDNTDEALIYLAKELNLSTPLSGNYTTQKLTGKGTTGDLSDNLKKGEVKVGKTDYSQYEIPNTLLEELQRQYKRVKSVLINNASAKLTN